MNSFVKSVFVLCALLCLFPFASSAQTADFETDDPTSGCLPSLQVHFKDKSVGATSWNWDLGNGNVSTEQNPVASYTQSGSYTVSLTINGSVTKTKTAYIVVYAKPVVDFTPNVFNGCSPLSVTFANNSTAGSGTISSYSWVFGDGATSTDATPTHIYTTPSLYTVTLTVTNQYTCSSTLVKNSLIDVRGPAVNFGASQTSFCLTPATAIFSNSTTGQNPISYQWNFGDQTSLVTQPSTSHTYTTSGSFDVTLTATDVNGCSATNKKTSFISVGTESGVDFSLSSSRVCIGESVTITNKTTIPVTNQQWDFGNGSQSSDLNTSVAYTKAGYFDITLKASLASGCNVSIVKRVEVVFDAAPDFKTVASCNQKISFQNTSIYTISSSWNFGDGTTSLENNPEHTYITPGVYQVKLTAYNALNCPVTIQKGILVNSNPIAGILPDQANSCTGPSLSGCAPFSIQFINNSASSLPLKSTLWSFGDNTTSSQSSPSHTFRNVGTYLVKLIITNSMDCSDTTTVVVKVSTTKPTAAFTADKTEACVKEVIKFTDQSSATADFWCWNFGDDSGSTEKNPEHGYSKPGVYTVTLTAKSGGCSDTIIKTQYIRVKDPFLEFTVVKNCSTPYDITLVNTSTGFTEFSWDFGDGTTNTQDANQVDHHFGSLGGYAVKLTLKNSATGCTVTDSKSVVIQDVEADFTLDSNPVCKSSPVSFTDQSKFAVMWAWSFKDGTTSSLTDPMKTFGTAGDYDVSLQVTDTDGCTDTKSIPVKVADIKGDFNFTATSTCTDLTVDFKDASVAIPPVQSWLWDFGDNTTSTDQNPMHIYHQQRSYPVKLTLENAEARCSVIIPDAVMFTNPSPDFLTLKNSLCVDGPVSFTNKSTLAEKFLWDFGNGQTSSSASPTASYDAPGKYSITLTATDQYGCEKSIVKTDYLEVLQPQASFEAFQTSAECPPLITSFKDKSSGDITKWKWNFGDGQSSILQNPTNTYEIPGKYGVMLEVTNFAGCSATYKINDLISLGGPYGDFSVTNLLTCVDEEIFFVADATNTTKYIWDFGDGVGTNTDQSSVSHTYKQAAPANLSLTLEDSKGCRVVAGKGKKIDLKAKPEVDFTYDPGYPFENEAVAFTASLREELDLTWTFDHDVIPGNNSIEKSFDIFGTHHVTLQGVNEYGCAGEAQKDILVLSDVKFIPNVFTPNEDQLNPTFQVEDAEKGFWELRVYNRWGQQVYSAKDYHNDWDGRNLSSGVYYYYLVNQYRESKNYKGYVQILR